MNNGFGGLENALMRGIDSGGWKEFLQESMEGSTQLHFPEEDGNDQKQDD
jgi:hypothetical protein